MGIILVWILTVIIFGAILLVVLTPLLYIVLFVGALIVSVFTDKQTSKRKKQKAKVREVKEDQSFEAVKKQFGWTDKYGDSYVSSKIGKVLWVEGSRWKLFKVSNGGSYEILEFEGNGKVSKMESDIKRHNNLVREFDQMVNGKIN